MIFQRNEYNFGPVAVHLMNFSDFDPSQFLHQLTSIETERFFSFSSIQRKREFVATRMLRHEIFGFQHIHYDKIGAPFIEGEGFISISHSKNIVGIATCIDFKIGLDIEPISDKIDKIKHKFLSIGETEKLDCNSLMELTKVWSGKESLYKISGTKGIDFRTQLEVAKVTEEEWKGIYQNQNNSFSTELNIFELDNRIISINTKACEKLSYTF